MRFIVDAQLPRLLTDQLVASGHDAVHVKQPPLPLRLDARQSVDAEVGMSELALDRHQRNAFARHLDSVSVPELAARIVAGHLRPRRRGAAACGRPMPPNAVLRSALSPSCRASASLIRSPARQSRTISARAGAFRDRPPTVRIT